MKDYFIKNGYQINEVNITSDIVSDTNYWTRDRIMAAEIFQFPVYKLLNKYIKQYNSDIIIDIGCGAGVKLKYINKKNPKIRIIGIDQADPIAFCKKTYSFGEWYSDDFENSQLSINIKSKLIISSDVIEHLINPDLLLNYIKSRLDDEGVVILSTPDRDSLRGRNCMFSPNKHHVREWNRQEFRDYLEDRGFVIIEHVLQSPLKLKFSGIFVKQVLKRILQFKSLKYNQVVVARLK
jgi:2-polyprenyl-3-methyl-5-hydroxy-6-metoxy-1,4-benzoquinol methylase